MNFTSPFGRYVRENDFAVIDSIIYHALPGGNDMHWGGKGFKLTQGSDCGLFELIFADMHEKELRDLCDEERKKLGSVVPAHEEILLKMVIEDFMPWINEGKMMSDYRPFMGIEDMLECGLDIMDATSSEDALYLEGIGTSLKQSDKREDYLKVNGKFYTRKGRKPIDIDKIDASFVRLAMRSVKETALREHEARNGIGLCSYEWIGDHILKKDTGIRKVRDGYTVFLKLPRFQISSGEKSYTFDTSFVAVNLSYDRYWRWDDPYVLGEYSHPFLRDIGGRNQYICMGNLRETLSQMKAELADDPSILPQQLKYVLESARDILSRGYQDEGIIPYHNIADLERRRR